MALWRAPVRRERSQCCLAGTSLARNVFSAILFESSSVHRTFHQPHSNRNLKLLKAMAAKSSKLAMELSHIAWLPEPNRGTRYLAHDGVFLALDLYLCDFR